MGRLQLLVACVTVVTAVAFFAMIILGQGQPPIVDALASIAGLGIGLLIALSAGTGERRG